MLHFEVDARALQRVVPFELDLRHGRAFVTLVAFAMENLRPRRGGKLSAWWFKPIATHDFLNVRTYVRTTAKRGFIFSPSGCRTGWPCNSAHAPSPCRIGMGTFVINMIGRAVQSRGESRMSDREAHWRIEPSRCSALPSRPANAVHWTNG